MPHPSCSRCGQSAHLASSIEVHKGHRHTTFVLCVWCHDLLAHLLAPEATEHIDGCSCDACDPDTAMELRRIPA